MIFQRFITRFLKVVLLSLFANVASAADLLDIYQEARLQDSTYSAAKAEYIAAQEILPQSEALMMPDATFEIKSDWNRIDFDSTTSFQKDYGSHQAGVVITQPLLRTESDLAIEIAKSRVSKSDVQLAWVEQDLMLRTAYAYFDVLLKRANLGAIRSQKVAVAEQLEEAKRNFLVGTATITDQREAQASYDLVVAQELGSQSELEVAQSAIEILVGRPVKVELAGLNLPVTLSPPDPNNMQTWVEKAYQNNLEIRLARESLLISQQEVRLQQAGHQPTLDAIGSHTFIDQPLSGLGSYTAHTTAIGIRFSMPLYKGGAIESRTREAIALQERMRQEVENNRRIAAQKTREAFLGVTSGLAQVRALEQAVASTGLQLESSKLGLEVGVRTAVDVLNAEEQLARAKSELYKAIYSTILNQIKLKAAVGDLKESDLADVNALLDTNIE